MKCYGSSMVSKQKIFHLEHRARSCASCFGNISQLETRPLIGWPSESINQRPGFHFQLTYVSKTLMLSKHLHMIRPLLTRIDDDMWTIYVLLLPTLNSVAWMVCLVMGPSLSKPGSGSPIFWGLRFYILRRAKQARIRLGLDFLRRVQNFGAFWLLYV